MKEKLLINTRESRYCIRSYSYEPEKMYVVDRYDGERLTEAYDATHIDNYGYLSSLSYRLEKDYNLYLEQIFEYCK